MIHGWASRSFSTVTLLLSVGACAFAQTQPPQPESIRIQQVPPVDLRGTDASPLIVNVRPTPQTDDEATREQREKEQESAA